MKEWIIAHKGAQCDAPGNTLEAFEACHKYPAIGWAELDLHTTKDGIVVCHHDFDIDGHVIADCTFEQLRELDPKLAKFDDAVNVLTGINLILDIKKEGTEKYIFETFQRNKQWKVASFEIPVLKNLINLGIEENRLILFQHHHPFFHASRAQKLGLGGIGVKTSYLMFLYPLARLKGLYIYAFTVNSVVLAWFLKKIFPRAGICTDRPDLMQKLD